MLHKSPVQCALISSIPNPFQSRSTSYNVPNTNIRVDLVDKYFPAHPSREMPSGLISHLISTGLVALDILAQQAGGDKADLNVPAIRWAIGGLAIQITDATTYSPHQEAVPRCRFDEVRAAYVGVGAAIGKIGDVEAGIRVFRRGSVLRRVPETFIGFGYLIISNLMEGGEGGNLTTTVA